MATPKYRLKSGSIGHDSEACGSRTSHKENNIGAVWRPYLVVDLASMSVAPPSEGTIQHGSDTDKAKKGLGTP